MDLCKPLWHRVWLGATGRVRGGCVARRVWRVAQVPIRAASVDVDVDVQVQAWPLGGASQCDRVRWKSSLTVWAHDEDDERRAESLSEPVWERRGGEGEGCSVMLRPRGEGCRGNVCDGPWPFQRASQILHLLHALQGRADPDSTAAPDVTAKHCVPDEQRALSLSLSLSLSPPPSPLPPPPAEAHGGIHAASNCARCKSGGVRRRRAREG